jgi:acyl-coenzyme A synthetase/AMP-(fatty) acid ligase
MAPDTFAYLLYTSGSTGQPKGVIENHRNVLHFTMSWTNRFHYCAEDRVGLVVPISFSASAVDIFVALLNGAGLCPFDPQVDGIDTLADWLIREEITGYSSVPVLFRQWVDVLTGEETFPALRVIRLGGDQVSRSDVERYRKHFAPGCILHNGLGAAEVKQIRGLMLDQETSVSTGVVPVGYAVDDTEVLLLDEEGRPVGSDEIGEIAVKTRFASPGYWRRPDLTEARFLPDTEGSDARIYLTGDLGRMDADGCLFVLGRKDFQVKIRGQRVEVAEVEQALLDLDAVKETVVVSREAGEERLGQCGCPLAGGRSERACTDTGAHEVGGEGRAPGAGDKRLVAYLVPSGARMPTVTELRRALARKLPDAMVPSAFVVLDALPLTESGKVDRRALPPPDRARPALEAEFIAPRTAIEERLAGLWGNLLALDAVGIHDNFFDLGGHSLLATQMLSRVQETFRCEVSLQVLFDAPTVAGLAGTLVVSESEPGRTERIARVRQRIDQMSAEEVQAALQQRQGEREAI